MISAEEARALILAKVSKLGHETVPLDDALGRVLATDVIARVNHPVADVSAMDGYALKAADIASASPENPIRLPVVAESAAGHPPHSPLMEGTAWRIFTGAVLPDGADTIVIQEDAEVEGDTVIITTPVPAETFVRRQGMDFAVGQTLLSAPHRLGSRDIALMAAMNHPWVPVVRRPRVAILSTGDEVKLPGEPLPDGTLPGSNGPGLAAMVKALGGLPHVLGVAGDDADSLRQLARAAQGFDLLLTTGGVSVGAHDLVKPVLAELGMQVGFHKVAMRPGKPLLFGEVGNTIILGLPGNPVSAMVQGALLLPALMASLQGLPDNALDIRRVARLGRALPANDRRQDYLRASLSTSEDGTLRATPFQRQDSALMADLAFAECLVIRPPHAEPAHIGDAVDVICFPSLV